jgi:hypothetical protein
MSAAALDCKLLGENGRDYEEPTGFENVLACICSQLAGAI